MRPHHYQSERRPGDFEEAGRLLVHCHAGCDQAHVIAALRKLGAWPESAPLGLTLAQLAEAKKLPLDFLRGLGVRDSWTGPDRTPCVVIPYLDSGGTSLATRKRLALSGDQRFAWERGARVTMYGLQRLADARKLDQVVVVEGESDAWSCWHAGIPAVGVPGAATWRSEWAVHLQGIGRVLVWREPDRGGDTLLARVGAAFPDALVIEAPPGIKDGSALWLTNPDVDAFRARMAELAQTARPVSQIRREALTEEARAALDASQGLLDDPDLLGRIRWAMRA